MQKGSLIRSSSRQGPDVWEYRWRESCSGQRRKHRRIVIGTLDTLKDESAALKSIAALRIDININDRRLRTKPLRLAELVAHYRQKELADDNEWKTLSTRVTYEGYLRKWIVPRWGSTNLSAIRAIEGDTKAKAHALKALEIDDSIAEAHASLSLVLDRNYDWASSERELKRAIELKPGYAMAHHWYATILDCQGRVDEGREQTRIGLQLDPTSLIINMSVGVTSYESREYDVAIEQLKQALDLDPAFPVTRHYLALVYAQKGRFADALAVLEKVTEPTPRYVGLRAYVLATSGDEATARRLRRSTSA